MLSSLKINDIAIIEEAKIQFDKGFNVMTGETGSGKSIIIDSLGAVIGARTSRDLIRDGAQEGKVSAVFDCVGSSTKEALTNYGIDCDDDSVMIQRIIKDGRSICRINGELVNVTALREIGKTLIDIHGQNDNQALLDAKNHFFYIDLLAKNSDIRAEYDKCYAELKDINKRLKKLMIDESEKERRIETLKYQIDEIENADLKIGEKDELVAQKKRIINFEKVYNALNASRMLLNGDDNNKGIISAAYDVLSFLSPLNECYEEVETLLEKINDSISAFGDTLDFVSGELSSFDGDKPDINRVEERLDLIYRLSKKYGKDEEEILMFLDKAKKEYEDLSMNEEKTAALTSEYNEKLEELISIGRRLTSSRKTAGEEFSRKITRELEFLDMSEAEFSVSITQGAVTSRGLDNVEFVISTNYGQPKKPLSKIASGGELSRIMLAIKCVLAENEDSKTLIFDEIDSGVSGRAAEKIGIKLKEAAKYSQVICVTHLAQIASFAHNHLFIEKVSDNGKTLTKVRKLD
ncbi:MAG: DNA repair protein RecN, partial [Acutalibacteraceae bacterium]